ncbi:MAG: type VII secretion target [Mycobacterium sp.]
MPESLKVNPDELHNLAKIQRDVAALAETGRKATADVGVGSKLSKTHGVISGPSNEMIGTVKEPLREQAAAAIKEACEALATALDNAATQYGETDTSNSADLQQQIQP